MYLVLIFKNKVKSHLKITRFNKKYDYFQCMNLLNASAVNKGRQCFSHQTLQQARRPGDDDHQLLDELRDEGNLHALRALVSLDTQTRQRKHSV